MPLPTLVVPEYECTLPFGQKVTYRPFLVREEKLLYMAMESQDQKEMIKAVKEIIKNCTSVKKIDTLATFDIEYLFLRIRAKSVGEVSEFKVVAPAAVKAPPIIVSLVTLRVEDNAVVPTIIVLPPIVVSPVTLSALPITALTEVVIVFADV